MTAEAFGVSQHFWHEPNAAHSQNVASLPQRGHGGSTLSLLTTLPFRLSDVRTLVDVAKCAANVVVHD